MNTAFESCDLRFYFDWQKRGQIWGCLDEQSKASSMLCKEQCEIKRQLLHLMLQGCIQDLKETGNLSRFRIQACYVFTVVQSCFVSDFFRADEFCVHSELFVSCEVVVPVLDRGNHF